MVVGGKGFEATEMVLVHLTATVNETLEFVRLLSESVAMILTVYVARGSLKLVE